MFWFDCLIVYLIVYALDTGYGLVCSFCWGFFSLFDLYLVEYSIDHVGLNDVDASV